ncbi:MAG: hypothetical protein RLY90_1051 [Pseudomonadota bacterium]
MTSRLLLGLQSLCIALLLVTSNAWSKDSSIYTALFSNLAVGGYDTVAYFTEGRPIKGDAHFFTQYEGVQWRFSSAKNRALFLENPQKYAPQYGGYCAWAVSQGYTASADPLRWRIVEGKLYLNYDADVQKKWEANIPDFIQKANQNWPNVLN